MEYILLSSLIGIVCLAAVKEYGSSDSGASLGAILGAALEEAGGSDSTKADDASEKPAKKTTKAKAEPKAKKTTKTKAETSNFAFSASQK